MEPGLATMPDHLNKEENDFIHVLSKCHSSEAGSDDDYFVNL